jgi:hypothetical protein
MSRYFFHIRDGLRFVPDEEGIECGDMKAVQDEAQASVRDLARAAVQGWALVALASIEVEDDCGNAIPQVRSTLWLN